MDQQLVADVAQATTTFFTKIDDADTSSFVSVGCGVLIPSNSVRLARFAPGCYAQDLETSGYFIPPVIYKHFCAYMNIVADDFGLKGAFDMSVSKVGNEVAVMMWADGSAQVFAVVFPDATECKGSRFQYHDGAWLDAAAKPLDKSPLPWDN